MKSLLIVGFGEIGKCYVKSLISLGGYDITVLANSKRSESVQIEDDKFFYLDIESLDTYESDSEFDYAIIAVPILETYSIIQMLLKKIRIKKYLVEKPVTFNANELAALKQLLNDKKINLSVLLNRRFLPSTLYVRKILESEKPKSATLIFNENINEIINSTHPELVKTNWLYANTIHVIDLFFYLIGPAVYINPKIINHKDEIARLGTAYYYGHGVTENCTDFNYFADWRISGRWVIQLFFEDFDIFLSPLENVILVNKFKNTDRIEFPTKNKPGFDQMLRFELHEDNFEKSNFLDFIKITKVMNKINMEQAVI